MDIDIEKADQCPVSRAVRYNDIYQMDEIKSLSFHIMLYRLYRGVAKYIVSGNTFFIIWVTAIFIRRSPRVMKGRQKQVEMRTTS